jgi:hypothetical protein
MKSNSNQIEKIIIKKAKELGASLAGIATVAALKAVGCKNSIHRYNFEWGASCTNHG